MFDYGYTFWVLVCLNLCNNFFAVCFFLILFVKMDTRYLPNKKQKNLDTRPEAMWREKSRSRMELCTRMVKQLLLKEVEKGNHENLVLSPLSIDVVLNMVAAGSRGRTLEKMLDLLGSKNIDEIKSQSLEMMAVATGDQYLNNGDDEPILCLVNRAWFDQRFTLKPSYKEDVLEGVYGCEAKKVDFVTRGNEVVDEINSWAHYYNNRYTPH
ncbi:serpin-ZX-like [Rhododendron vialii]|uniref:serpin-ZX-like n=1 Tax=Rhododendron vialii TaxID=182163 RepID=UPI00265E59CD|nr:serpin-ZX-like [Rhododendron vialii]